MPFIISSLCSHVLVCFSGQTCWPYWGLSLGFLSAENRSSDIRSLSLETTGILLPTVALICLLFSIQNFILTAITRKRSCLNYMDGKKGAERERDRPHKLFKQLTKVNQKQEVGRKALFLQRVLHALENLHTPHDTPSPASLDTSIRYRLHGSEETDLCKTTFPKT